MAISIGTTHKEHEVSQRAGRSVLLSILNDDDQFDIDQLPLPADEAHVEWIANFNVTQRGKRDVYRIALDSLATQQYVFRDMATGQDKNPARVVRGSKWVFQLRAGDPSVGIGK